MLESEKNAELPYYLAFVRFPKFGAKRVKQIHERFGDLKTAWRASHDDLLSCNIHPNIIGEFVRIRPTIHPEQELDTLAKHGLDAVTYQEDIYPSLLKEIHDPPPVLFVRGNLPSKHEPLVSIVGTRKITSYGERIIERIVPELIEAGVSIVSGLALGCDGYAHHHSVESGGKTYGVLAGGCDWENVGPSRNRPLARRMIATGGGLMSEFPTGTISHKGNFPVRNRIISGLSKATLVIEAAGKSGSLITAYSALEQNREVMAIPGPIGAEFSVGPNQLLKKGAHAITCTEDILEVLEMEVPTKQPTVIEPENADEALILPLIQNESLHVDDIVLKSQLPTQLVLQTLTGLELRNVIKHTGGNHYSRKR
ncbi:MAG: DNA-processing protein DprA [bacterium]|nr:DNA-processing protein DprA [bacterium]